MKKQRFLFTLLMAIAMMAFSPQRVWAQEEGGDEDTHAHSYSGLGDSTEPDCVNPGQGETHECECGHSYKDDDTPALGHDFEYIMNYDGTHYLECSRCYEPKDPEPCSFVNGVCTKCGYKCEHEWDNSRCTVCGLVCNNHTYNTDGNCNTCDATTDIVSVTIGGIATNYRSLSDALTAALNADAATITLLQNFTQNASITISQGNVTLDLNGHTIKQPNGTEILKLSGGSLTIVDSSVGKTGLMQINGNYALNVTGGSLTIHGGTFCSYNSALYITSTNVTASLDGGIFKANISGIYNISGKSILAEGYSFYNSDVELYDAVNGTVWDGNSPALDITVKRATVKGTLTIGGVTTDYYNFNTAFSQALDAESATMQIQKDVDLVNGSSTYSLDMDRGNLTLDLNGHTINKPRGGNVLNQSGGELTIIDSSVGKTGTMQTVGSSALNVTGGAITIHGGTFKAGSGIAFYVANSTVNVSIDGGQFVGSSAIYLGGKSALAFGYSYYISGTDTELSDVTSGFVMTSNGNATDITVKPATVKATLTIGGETTDYYDFKKAFDDALEASSATITMLGNVPLSSPLTVAKGNVTLDLNGHTISTSGPNTLNLSGGSLTIKDSSVGKTGTMKTSGSYALNVTGGSVTILGGTFSASSYALNITSSNVTASLEGGVFKASGGGGINNQSGKSILADGYAFYNSNDEELPERTTDYILEGNDPARDITVKPATVKATLTIGGETTNYYTFMTAFNAALNSTSPATMTLLADVDLYAINNRSPKTLEFDKGNVTLDLNGHSIIEPIGGNILNISAGSLTITDSSAGKTGKMQTEIGNVINVSGGSLTVLEGTFITSSNNLYISSTTATVTLKGGRFQTKSTSIVAAAVYNNSGKSILADGFAFYNALTEVRLWEGFSGEIRDEDGNFAHDVIVECDHDWNDGTCSKCGKVCKHNFYDWAECKICGFECTHEGSKPNVGDPASYHDCPVCQNTFEHDFINGVCTECGYVCPQHKWSNETGRCNICEIECDHDCDNDGHCSICGATCENVIVTIGGVSKRHFDLGAAIDAAENAGEPATITLLQDVQTNVSFNSGNVTLDLNGYTITGNYTTVLYLDGASLTITDSSAGKTGKIVNSHGVINAYSGVLTIQGGTFTSNNTRPLYCSLSEFSSEPLVVSIEGGRFITESQSSSAIYSDFGTNILAPGYGFYNTDTDARLTYFNNEHYLVDACDNLVKDVTVKVIPVLASVTTSNGTVEYTDLVEARDAASNAGEPATITLLHDAKTDVNSTVTFYSGNVTLDLNGYTITSEYSSVIDVAGGSLTITDSSAGKTGKMVNADTAIYAYGGTINIQGGTFTSNNHTALYCISSEFSREPLAVSIEGGRFITKNENMSAIYSEVGSLLAPGYGFYNTDTDARLTYFVDHQLMNENGNPAKDVTVRLLIDEMALADATPYDGENAGCTVTDFTYTRDFGGTNWTTWYVPFDLELTDEICQKLAFSRINNVHQYDDDDNGVPDRTIIESFRQKAGVTLKANYPYLVKVLNDADRNIELRLSNVTLAPAAENSIDCQSVDYIYTFTGTYAGMGDSGLGSNSPYSLNDTYWDNNWYHFRSLEPQRHYMVIEPTNGAQAPRNIKVRLNVAGEEDATGIVTLYSDKEKMQGEVEVYDLMGRKLNSNSPQRGLRIQNGKVIFNK